MSRFKNMLMGSVKHKKLPDEQNLAINQDFDGDDTISSSGTSTYKLKYLGHIPVDLSKNTEETATKAIDLIISLSKVHRKRIQKVVITVNIKGIEVTDSLTRQPLLYVSIFRICSCLAYAKSKRVFSFLATDAQGTTECHAFLCPKRSVAEGLAITVAQMFSTVSNMCQSEQSELFGSNQLNDAQPSSYIKYDEDVQKDSNKSLLSRLHWKKTVKNSDRSPREKLPFSTSPLTFAEVYPSAPPYTDKPNSWSQSFDDEDWTECTGVPNNSIELIVF